MTTTAPALEEPPPCRSRERDLSLPLSSFLSEPEPRPVLQDAFIHLLALLLSRRIAPRASWVTVSITIAKRSRLTHSKGMLAVKSHERTQGLTDPLATLISCPNVISRSHLIRPAPGAFHHAVNESFMTKRKTSVTDCNCTCPGHSKQTWHCQRHGNKMFKGKIAEVNER